LRGAHGFIFELDEELSDDNLVAVIVTTPSGKTLQLYAEVELAGRTMILRQLAIYGLTATAGGLGVRALFKMAHAAMEDFDVDRICIEDTRRVSVAGAGRAVRPIEFRRQARQDDSEIAEFAPPG
jgi:hypothetical protein